MTVNPFNRYRIILSDWDVALLYKTSEYVKKYIDYRLAPYLVFTI